MSLMLAGAALVVLVILNRLHVSRTGVYVCIGIALWIFVLKSGVHATLAGVALGLLIPLKRRDGAPFVHAIEEALHPYVKFLILPLFAFANAGIPLDGFAASKLVESLPLGIGIATAVSVMLGIAKLPDECNWGHMAGIGFLAGIGFTMSLFIGSLAFEAPELGNAVRVGVIAGSLIATAIGIALLAAASRRQA